MALTTAQQKRLKELKSINSPVASQRKEMTELNRQKGANPRGPQTKKRIIKPIVGKVPTGKKTGEFKSSPTLGRLKLRGKNSDSKLTTQQRLDRGFAKTKKVKENITPEKRKQLDNITDNVLTGLTFLPIVGGGARILSAIAKNGKRVYKVGKNIFKSKATATQAAKKLKPTKKLKSAVSKTRPKLLNSNAAKKDAEAAAKKLKPTKKLKSATSKTRTSPLNSNAAGTAKPKVSVTAGTAKPKVSVTAGTAKPRVSVTAGTAKPINNSSTLGRKVTRNRATSPTRTPPPKSSTAKTTAANTTRKRSSLIPFVAGAGTGAGAAYLLSNNNSSDNKAQANSNSNSKNKSKLLNITPGRKPNPPASQKTKDSKLANSFPDGLGSSIDDGLSKFIKQRSYGNFDKGLATFNPGMMEKGLAALGGGKERDALTSAEDSYFTELLGKRDDVNGLSDSEKDYIKNFRKKKGGKVIAKKKGSKVIAKKKGSKVMPKKKGGTVYRRGGGKALRGFGKATYSNKPY
tara:strand:+ start:42 stop:1589 length:1548 start_codon:yes stop_codon:yes gene_type:complete